MPSILQTQFSTPLLQWFDIHGRKDLPWQNPRTAYQVWISEIMLQQTQVQTVIAYFHRFMERFPTVFVLAQAQEDEVLSLWSGLGYYSRARNLHKTAKILVDDHGGEFPQDLGSLYALPGIGPSTAAAILSQAFNQPTAILDGNVKRVLARFFRIAGWPEQAQVKKKLWELAQSCMPNSRCADYTQAIMDLGALCCTSKKPNCVECPVKTHCQAYQHKEQLLYPSKKVKKPVPTLAQQFLVLSNAQGLIYLEKRPPSGLWGGLWCLPSLEQDDCALGFIKLKYALLGDAIKPLLSFKHQFSHFHLLIDALHIKTQPLQDRVSEGLGKWFALDQLHTLGLAKPTSLILSKLG
ncbi:MAG: A/G-specific adenine glycosylase [Legionella sp.]|nr:MAG: A/G-specific adenine glycosylase [Legionella sp.]